jgi:hypothetical protein
MHALRRDAEQQGYAKDSYCLLHGLAPLLFDGHECADGNLKPDEELRASPYSASIETRAELPGLSLPSARIVILERT